jgi:hypothetical protein
MTTTSQSGDASLISPSIAFEDGQLVLRMHAPEIDASTVDFDTHSGYVHLKASGTKADGSRIELDETVRVEGGDESRATVAKEGDDLVIRMPRG